MSTCVEDFTYIADVKRNECLLKTEKFFVVHKSRWLDSFYEHFKAICAEIRNLQDESELPAISYLEYTALYTNFINRQYVADVFVYGEKGFLDKAQYCVGRYDVSFLFYYFDRLWDDLLSLRKRYVGKIPAQKITAFMLDTLPDFYSYLAQIARCAIFELTDASPLVDIKKTELFVINVGGYMSITEGVYQENGNKHVEKLCKWFSEQLYGTYIFGDYSRLDFSDRVFEYTDFRFAHFCGSSLNNTNLKGSKLIGANFRSANMEKCQLDYCTINEADFSSAILKNANFKNAHAKSGLINDKDWKFPGFLPTNFRYADLTNADFTGANLAGADFTGATLTGANFTDAVLDGAIFDNNGAVRK